MLTRAYSLLHVKSVDAERRVITGMATTPETDRQGDIVEPLGVTYAKRLPLLLYHDSKRPVGTVSFQTPTKRGIAFEASLPAIVEPGTLKDRVDEAWHSVKAGLLAGVSIGFRALEDGVEILKSGGIRFLKTEVLELSLVAIPANASAVIQTIKSLDTGLAALGTESEVDPSQHVQHSSGASDMTRGVVKALPHGRSMKKTIQDQISSFEAERAAKHARLMEVQGQASDEGRSKDEAEKEEYKNLKAEIKSIDDELVDLRELEEVSKSAAKPIQTSSDDGTGGRGRVITVKDNLPQGIKFARYAMCLASANGNRGEALEIALKRYPENKDIHTVLKAAVAAGTTTDSSWAGPLVQYQDFAGDFVEYLRPMTILGKFGTGGIPALRKVPFKTRVGVQSAGGSAYWVGEGLPKPLTKSAFTTMTLDFHKVATISVLTQEEVRFSNPSAEAKVRDDLAAAVVARIDQDFTDPTNAGTANVKPASITNGLAATAASGTDADHLTDDFALMAGKFVTANISPTSGVLIMSATQALSISLMKNALGQREFPEMTMTGGTLFGMPVIVSEYLQSQGSPGTGMIIMVSAQDIYLADDGQVTIDVSREASVEMLDSSLVQNSTTGTGTSLVSLWQSNLVGVRAEREVTWRLRRAAGVAYISNAAYVA